MQEVGTNSHGKGKEDGDWEDCNDEGKLNNAPEYI